MCKSLPSSPATVGEENCTAEVRNSERDKGEKERMREREREGEDESDETYISIPLIQYVDGRSSRYELVLVLYIYQKYRTAELI